MTASQSPNSDRDRAGTVAAIIVNYRTPDLTLASIAALDAERRAGVLLDVTVIDGGSNDGSAERLREGIAAAGWADWVTLVALDCNGGFGWADNQGIRRVLRGADPSSFVYLVNPDAAVLPGAVAALVAALEAEPAAAAAGSQLLTTDGRELTSAFRFPGVADEFFRGANTPALERLLGHPPLAVAGDATVTADWVTGASVMFRSAALRQCGLFDEGFFLYFEEVELMSRLAGAGWTVLHVPTSRVRHIGGAATGVVDGSSQQPRLPDYWYRSRRRFFARTRGRGGALASGIAWLAGYTVWQLRKAAGLGRASGHADREARDLVRNGIVPVRQDGVAAVPAWDSAIDVPPAWMTWR